MTRIQYLPHWNLCLIHQQISKTHPIENLSGSFLNHLLLLLKSNLSFCLFLGISNWLILVVGSVFFLIRWILQAILVNKSGKILCEKSHFFSLILYDLFQPIIDWRFRTIGRFAKKRWKFPHIFINYIYFWFGQQKFYIFVKTLTNYQNRYLP
jgi:hypothetical protein